MAVHARRKGIFLYPIPDCWPSWRRWEPGQFSSVSRMRAVASNPSISGIAQSIRIKSQRPSCQAIRASRPFPAIRQRQPSILSIPSATIWLVRLSSTTRMRGAGRVAAGSGDAVGTSSSARQGGAG